MTDGGEPPAGRVAPDPRGAPDPRDEAAPPGASAAGLAFVAGATGYVGRALVARLAGSPGRVIAHVRPESSAGEAVLAELRAAGAELDRTPWEVGALAATLAALAPTRVFVLVGTTRRRMAAARRRGERAGYADVDRNLPLMLVDAALRADVRPTFVYLSALGADPAARSPYLRARGEVERALAASPLPGVVVRPSFVTGPDRRESRPAERVGAAAVDAGVRGLAALGWKEPLWRFGSLDAAETARALAALSVDPSARGRIVAGRRLREAARGT